MVHMKNTSTKKIAPQTLQSAEIFNQHKDRDFFEDKRQKKEEKEEDTKRQKQFHLGSLLIKV